MSMFDDPQVLYSWATAPLWMEVAMWFFTLGFGFLGWSVAHQSFAAAVLPSLVTLFGVMFLIAVYRAKWRYRRENR